MAAAMGDLLAACVNAVRSFRAAVSARWFGCATVDGSVTMRMARRREPQTPPLLEASHWLCCMKQHCFRPIGARVSLEVRTLIGVRVRS